MYAALVPKAKVGNPENVLADWNVETLLAAHPSERARVGSDLGGFSSLDQRLVGRMSWCSGGEQISLERKGVDNPVSGRIYNKSLHPGRSARSLRSKRFQLIDPHKETVMVSKTKDARTIPAPRQVVRRQTHIRESWSPTERRERARQASAQMGLLWALINTPQRSQS